MSISDSMNRAAGKPVQFSEQSNSMFLFMNKNRIICKFKIEMYGELEDCVIVEEIEKMPAHFPDMGMWISNRSAAKHREHIRKILKETGGETMTGFIRLTHCLSVNDTFWIKSENENVSWEDVNLYDNEFSEVISKLSFEGGGIYGEQFSTSSPELTTDGAYDKCWIRRNGSIVLIKVGSSGASNAGMEPYSEVLASQVFNRLIPDNSVVYALEKYHGKVVSVCELFTTQDICYYPYAAFMNGQGSVLNVLREYAKYDDEDTFRRMLVGDAITVNSDRHFKNFGWLCDTETKRLRMAPVFDFNMAFSPYADARHGFDDYDAYLEECCPAIGTGYVATAKSMLTPAIRSDLINLKSLKLEIPCDDKFTTDRLYKINNIKDVMIDRILGRSAVFAF